MCPLSTSLFSKWHVDVDIADADPSAGGAAAPFVVHDAPSEEVSDLACVALLRLVWSRFVELLLRNMSSIPLLTSIGFLILLFGMYFLFLIFRPMLSVSDSLK